MAREPSYPDDAPVGKTTEEPKSAGDAASEKPEGSNRTRKIVTGAAIGIGSAALVAALMYANRSRKSGNEDKK